MPNVVVRRALVLITIWNARRPELAKGTAGQQVLRKYLLRMVDWIKSA
jgi:hypothetical protein